MKVYVLTDLEGATGVVHYDSGDAERRKKDGEALISDINAAVAGAFDAGAEAVAVYDGHGEDAVQLSKLDPPATLIKRDRPESYLPGLNGSFTHLALVGLHSMAGAGGLLSHTYSVRVRRVMINGREIGEIGLSFIYARHYGVIPVFISGDDKAVEEARLYVSGIEGVAVKQSISETSGECLPPNLTYRLIRSGVYNAMVNHEPRCQNLPLSPYEMEVVYKRPWVALPRYLIRSRYDNVKLKDLYRITFKETDFIRLMDKFMGCYREKQRWTLLNV